MGLRGGGVAVRRAGAGARAAVGAAGDPGGRGRHAAIWHAVTGWDRGGWDPGWVGEAQCRGSSVVRRVIEEMVVRGRSFGAKTDGRGAL